MEARILIEQRLHQTATSWRELQELLGIHRRNFNLLQLPVQALLDLAQRLDLPLTVLLPQLQTPTTTSTPPGQADHDTIVILAALLHARTALTQADLAETLDWPLTRVAAALQHLADHPHLAGPCRLHRVPPERYALHPRTDLLTTDQFQAVRDVRGTLDGLTPREAAMLRFAIAYRDGHGHEFTDYMTANPEIVGDLLQRGLLHVLATAKDIWVDPDVVNSLCIHPEEPDTPHVFGQSARWGEGPTGTTYPTGTVLPPQPERPYDEPAHDTNPPLPAPIPTGKKGTSGDQPAVDLTRYDAPGPSDPPDTKDTP